MSENGPQRTKTHMGTPAPHPSYDELKALRVLLLKAARVAEADREDVVQDAMFRAVQEDVRPAAPPLQARALRKLRDASADLYRRRSRKREPQEVESLEAHGDIALEDATIKVTETADMIEAIAGADVLKYVRWASIGMTEREIAEQPGWSTKRAGAARRQLSRKMEALARAYED